jgi:hypothetical protein
LKRGFTFAPKPRQLYEIGWYAAMTGNGRC